MTPPTTAVSKQQQQLGNTTNTSGRQSPRLQQQASSQSQAPDMAQILVVLKELKAQNTQFLQDQASVLERLDINCQEIKKLKEENVKIRGDINLINEKYDRLDQYSRKNVMIVTGVEYQEDERQHKLEETIIGMINKISNMNYTLNDFIAIHRNGNKHKGTRPPSVTVKFIRYFDKDRLFTKSYIQARKSLFRGISFFHCMCPGLIAEQSRISSDSRVKFVNFNGPTFFTVCVKGVGSDMDVFYNRIHSYGELLTRFDG